MMKKEKIYAIFLSSTLSVAFTTYPTLAETSSGEEIELYSDLTYEQKRSLVSEMISQGIELTGNTDNLINSILQEALVTLESEEAGNDSLTSLVITRLDEVVDTQYEKYECITEISFEDLSDALREAHPYLWEFYQLDDFLESMSNNSEAFSLLQETSLSYAELRFEELSDSDEETPDEDESSEKDVIDEDDSSDEENISYEDDTISEETETSASETSGKASHSSSKSGSIHSSSGSSSHSSASSTHRSTTGSETRTSSRSKKQKAENTSSGSSVATKGSRRSSSQSSVQETAAHGEGSETVDGISSDVNDVQL